jgi:hypothetical protein
MAHRSKRGSRGLKRKSLWELVREDFRETHWGCMIGGFFIGLLWGLVDNDPR